LFELSLPVISQQLRPTTAILAQVPGSGPVWASPVPISTLHQVDDVDSAGSNWQSVSVAAVRHPRYFTGLVVEIRTPALVQFPVPHGGALQDAGLAPHRWDTIEMSSSPIPAASGRLRKLLCRSNR
jgi:hypothetical protein